MNWKSYLGLFGIAAGLRAFLYAGKLVPPVSLKCSGPFVERLDGFCIGAIEHLAAVAADVDEADFEQDAEVLGDGWLWQIEGGDDVVYGALPGDEEAENVAAAGFGHSVEGVGGGRSARHERIIFLYGNMSRGIFQPGVRRLFQ